MYFGRDYYQRHNDSIHFLNKIRKEYSAQLQCEQKYLNIRNSPHAQKHTQLIEDFENKDAHLMTSRNEHAQAELNMLQKYCG